MSDKFQIVYLCDLKLFIMVILTTSNSGSISKGLFDVLLRFSVIVFGVLLVLDMPIWFHEFCSL